jgi:hypothetical protein
MIKMVQDLKVRQKIAMDAGIRIYSRNVLEFWNKEPKR